MSASPRAVLFDVDGTLVDTSYLHTVTWWQAFAQGGQHVAMADIHRAIGMGSDQLLDRLLPDDRDRDADSGKAGVPCIGLLSGGIGREEPADAGAAQIYAGPGELLARLSDSLIGG
jgi:phosphoglycolate phosphatase-like HAD superfamily hydrolase